MAEDEQGTGPQAEHVVSAAGAERDPKTHERDVSGRNWAARAVPAGLLAGAATLAIGAYARRRRRGREEAEGRHRERMAGLPATFTGEGGSGGPGAGADMGRGGTSTPTGAIAGGSSPGSYVDAGDGTVVDRDALPTGGSGEATAGPPQSAGASRDEGISGRPGETFNRTPVDMAPGVPEGSGRGFEKALDRTRPATPGNADDRPDAEKVRRDDRGRTTM